MSSEVGSNVGTSNGPFNMVGNPKIVRRATYNQITGVRKTTSDIMPADVGASSFVYAGIVACPYPNAIIKSIDVSEAEAAGAVTLSALDYDYLPQYSYYSTSGGRVRGPLPWPQAMYVGQPVVVVGAATPDLANDACNLVKVEYEPLPYVFDVEEALQPSAPQLWPGGNSPNNSVGIDTAYPPNTAAVTFGDVDSAIAEADAVITLPVLNTQFMAHFDMEPKGQVTLWPSADSVTMRGNFEYMTIPQAIVSGFFGLPFGNVIASTGLGGADTTTGSPVVGGSFGNKIENEEMIWATALAKKAGSPVKLLYTRYEHVLASQMRFPVRGYVTIAGKAGKITAVRAVTYSNCGALSGANTELSEFYDTYTVPNMDVIQYCANTNAYCQSVAMRDVGESQISFMMETAVDMLAQKLNIDPTTFRLNNMITAGYTDPATGNVYPDTAFDPSTGQPFSGFGQPGAHLKAIAAFNWSGRWKGWNVPSNTLTNSGKTQGTGMKLRGVGVSLLSGAKGSAAYGTGQISVSPTGAITIYSGGMDHGAGGNTTLPLIAAEALGKTDFSNMTVIMGDSSLTTDTGGTYGSMMTRNGGMGLISAAQDLASQWFPVVAAKLAPGTKASNLAFQNNTIVDTTNPKNSMSFNAAAALLTTTITGHGSFFAPPGVTFRVGGTKICEVEVDTETADVKVINAVCGVGIGRVIFKTGADGQFQGGWVGQGNGESLYEEILLDSSTGLKYSGGSLNANFLDFKVPTITTAPDSVEVVYEEYVDPIGPYGAVGIGENGQTACTPCVYNALSNALGGYRFTKMPVRKEDIVTALEWLKTQPNSPI
jgi:CO/xanthine dehydrogenase Mo-binding subunit